MTILVTGAAGFIGANLSHRLLKSGHHVVGIDNFITGRPENVRQLYLYPNFTFIKHDITQPLPKTTNYQLLTTNCIYHLACPTGVENLARLSRQMLLTCSVGTQNVLDLAHAHRAKLLFTSSSEVYGNPQVFPQDETYTGNVDPVGFRSPYEEGKRFAESLIAAYVRKYRLDAKIVRVFNTYGPGMSEKDSRVIPTFLRQATRGGPLTVKGRGVQKRTFCYVDDLVEGLIAVMKKGQSGQVYNLGSDREISILELAQVILHLTKTQSGFKFIKREKHDHQMRLPSLERAKHLGWRPQTSLESGLKKTISHSQGTRKEKPWRPFPARWAFPV